MLLKTHSLGNEEYNLVNGNEKVANLRKSFFGDRYFFTPEKKYEDKLKDIKESSYCTDLIHKTAIALEATYIESYCGEYVVQYSCKPVGWVVCVGNLDLIKWVPYMHDRKVSNKGALHMHATKFFKRDSARKVAKLCDGKVFSWPYLFPIIAEKLKTQETIRKNLQKMADDFRKDENSFDYDLVKSHFELLGNLEIWQGLYFLHGRYLELSAADPVSII